MSPSDDTARSLSLFEIQRGLADLIAEREECENDAEREAVDNALTAYVKAEVEKVDGIRQYLRHCEVMSETAQQEAERFRMRSKAWQSRADGLKLICLRVMLQANKKKLEGNTGSLTVRANGGLAPLIITDSTMIPEECVRYEGKIDGPVWLRTVKQCPWLEQPFAGEAVKMERIVNNTLVREALAKGPVAGAFLEERGKALVVK